MTADGQGVTCNTLYHHGNLSSALLASARELLESDGISALKLRAITRHAGVSATAATPHFGNLAGLLSVLAAEGFEELADAMAPECAPQPRDVALAYVRFAIENPGMFTLMFRSDAVARTNGRFQAASARAFERLSGLAQDVASGDRAAAMIALWGKVHGVAVLAIDGFLNGLVGAADPRALRDVLERVFQ